MSSQSEDLRHDAASLYRFVTAVCSRCDGQSGSPSYANASIEFFDYVLKLGESTKVYLQSFLETQPKEADLYYVYRQKLVVIRSGWSLFHKFVKSAADAHTLEVPSALISILTGRVNEIPGFENSKFSVFHTSEVNYFQLRASSLRDLATRLTTIVPGAPSFPSNLGMIQIPYSQSSSLYLNCLLPHEMGHFVFQEGKIAQNIAGSWVKALVDATGSQFSALSHEDKIWIFDKIRSWSEELFCDLFAVYLIGPAYTFAFIELFDLPRALGPDKSAFANDFSFSVSHPASLYRVRQQVLLLKDLGWWPEIEKIDSHYARLMASVTTIADGDFSSTPTSNLGAHALQSILQVTPVILGQLMKMLATVDSGLQAYQDVHESIELYLAHGVVPSTVVQENGLTVHPTPVATINASYKFYLESLDRLLYAIHGQDPNLLSIRASWTDRVQQWTMKALTDHQLLAV